MWGRHLMMLYPNRTRHQNRISVTSSIDGAGAGARGGRRVALCENRGGEKDRKVTTYL